MNIVDMCIRHKIYKLEFELDLEKWNDIDPKIEAVVQGNWESVKFLNDQGDALNQDMDNIPDNQGGIYMFLLKPNIIPNKHIYILYIGRARRKMEYSLRKRCKTYLTDSRQMIAYMREVWGRDLYIDYLPLNDDELIEQVERELLRVIIPPCNTQIPEYNITVGKDEKVLRGE